MRRGLISERRLAIAAGCSQPHMHHVLAGLRRYTPALADRIGRALGVTLPDLYTLAEVEALVADSLAERRIRAEVELELAA